MEELPDDLVATSVTRINDSYGDNYVAWAPRRLKDDLAGTLPGRATPVQPGARFISERLWWTNWCVHAFEDEGEAIRKGVRFLYSFAEPPPLEEVLEDGFAVRWREQGDKRFALFAEPQPFGAEKHLRPLI